VHTNAPIKRASQTNTRRCCNNAGRSYRSNGRPSAQSCGYRSARNSRSRACNTRSGNNNRYHTRLRMDPPHIRPEKLRRRLRRAARAKAFVCGALLHSLLLFSSDDSLSLSSEFPFFFRDRRFASAESELRRIRTILISQFPLSQLPQSEHHVAPTRPVRITSLIIGIVPCPSFGGGSRSGAWVSQLVGLASICCSSAYISLPATACKARMLRGLAEV